MSARGIKHGALANIHERLGLVYAWVVLVIAFIAVRPEIFLSWGTYASMLGGQAMVVTLTLALIIPLTAGEFDLSVAAMLSLSSMIIAVLNVDHQWPVGIAIGVSLASSVIVGGVNAIFTIGLGINSLIVTLGMATLLQGIVRWISDERTIYGISNGLVDAVITHRVFGIALSFYYALLICVFLWYVFNMTPYSRRLLFVGFSREVARLNGVNVEWVRALALLSSSVIAALAGIIYVGMSGAADPVSGFSLLLPAYAGAFLGSTTIVPGRFNPWGSFFAMYFLATGITGLVTLGAQSFVQDLFYGGALIFAVAVAQILRGRRDSNHK
jgi:ribose transport system permease protein